MALYTTNNRRLNEILHSSKGSSYSVSLVTILVVLLMLLLAILPAYRSITDQITNNQAKSTYLTALNAKKDTLNRLQEQYNNNQQLIDTFNEYNLSRNNNELLTVNLDAIARTNSVTMESVRYDKVVAPKDAPINGINYLMAQQFNGQFKGTLPNLEAMLAYIETFPVVFSFTSVTYSHPENPIALVTITKDPQFTMNLTGYYYFWNQPQATKP